MAEQYSSNLRRMRQSALIRELCQEVRLSHKQMIQPYFVVQSLKAPQEVKGLTGVYQDTADSLLHRVETDLKAGVQKMLLFGVPSVKSSDPRDFRFTAQTIEQLRKTFGKDLWIAVDICLCSYTESGHCGLLDHQHTYIDNHPSVVRLAEQALLYAQAGADCVAPSDMMDNRIDAIRNNLEIHGLSNTLIMSYAVKFHSSFYGPFRDAADSAPKDQELKDRATYQLDPARSSDAYQCGRRDAAQGADILMIKPGLPYLDILQGLSQAIRLPWAVYQVSGEYAAIELMAREGLIQRQRGHLEAWTAFVRAGAQMIVTYGARFAKEWIKES